MPIGEYKDFADCVAKNQDKDNPEAYCGKIKHQVEDSKSEGKLELKDPRGDGAVLDDRGQPNIIDYSNQEPLLFGLGDNSSHEYPGKIVITNESRYVDREVKRSHIPNVAATGRDATGADKTQPTLPTGAPYELQKPSHNMHGMNFNTPIDWSKQEVVSLPGGLVARQVGCTKDCKKEGGVGSGRLKSLAGKISAQAPIVASQLINLATQIPLEGVEDAERKEMVEALLRDEAKKVLREAQFVEQEHPRDEEGKFSSKGEMALETSKKQIKNIYSKGKQDYDSVVQTANDFITTNDLRSELVTKHKLDTSSGFDIMDYLRAPFNHYTIAPVADNPERVKELWEDLASRDPQIKKQYEQMKKNVNEANETTKKLFDTAPEFYRGTSLAELDSYLEHGKTGMGKPSTFEYDFTAVTPDREISDIYGSDVTIEYDGDFVRKHGEPVDYDMFFKKLGPAYETKKDGKMDAYYMDQAEVRMDSVIPISELKIKSITIRSDDEELIKKYSKLDHIKLKKDEDE